MKGRGLAVVAAVQSFGNSPAHLSSCCFPLPLLPRYVAFFLFWELPKLISALGPLHLQFMFGKQET